jgi:SAM-dependent methyltransferase
MISGVKMRALNRLVLGALLLPPVGLFGCGGAHPHGGGHEHPSFDNPQAWAEQFNSPERDAWQKPEQVVRHMELSSDSVVADLGAGTGYFVMRILPEVPVGKVYAVDVEAAMVDYTVQRSRRGGFEQVQGVVAAPDDPRLPEPVDVVLIVNTYHHLPDRPRYFRALASKVKAGGRVVLVDYKTDPEIPGPPLAMRLTADQVAGEMAEAGWRLKTRSEGFLPRQYLLIFER